MLEALKDVMASIGSKLRRGAKPGVNLDKLVEQMEDHEVSMRTHSEHRVNANATA